MMHAKVYTYSQTPATVGQPNNGDAWGIGQACSEAADDPTCGDYIDRGLILLRELQERGYGIVRLTDSASVDSGFCPDGTPHVRNWHAPHTGDMTCAKCGAATTVTVKHE